MAMVRTRPAATPALPLFRPSVAASTPLRERAWNAVPLLLSLTLVSTLFWGPYLAPWVFGAGMVAFFVYWLIRAYAVAVACLVGLRRVERWKRTNWRARYAKHRAWAKPARELPAWDWPRHMVIIPNYREQEAGLARTLDSLAAQANAGQLVVVMAMEEREDGCRAKAARLITRYHEHFVDMFATFHPAGLPGDTPGKGSNEVWAAREAYNRLIERGGGEIERYTVTSCDADAVFHERHFDALNYLFLTGDDPYRTFWQPAIFNSNNIWEIPAPLRLPDGLLGINRLSNLVMPGSVKFPTSCYTLSWSMLHEAGYWDPEVIPEDWHVYMKCCYTLGDRVHVEPLLLPLGNDCVLAGSYWKTLKAHYAQSVRHAWGASDIPYAWRASLGRGSPLGARRRFLLAGAVAKVHSLWMAQWYIVTLGSQLPVLLTRHLGAGMPAWWTATPFRLPAPSWHPGALLAGDFANTVGFWVNFSIVTLLIYVCLAPLLVMITVEYRTRGPRPAHVSRRTAVLSLTIWPAMAIITFFWASMPALHAQLKLARGHGLVYRVAEKGSRATRGAAPTPALPHAAPTEPIPEPVGAAGGGA